MWACEDDWHSQLFEDLQRGLAGVVRGVVDHDGGVVVPVVILRVELLDERVEEDPHRVRVRVRLHEAHVDLASCIQSEDHRDSRKDLQLGYRVEVIMWPPLPPAEVRHTEPSLVDVDNDLLLVPLLDEFEGKLLSQYEVLDAVGMNRYRVDLLVAHSELISQDVGDLFLPCFDVMLRLQLLLQAIYRVDDLSFLVHLGHCCSDLFSVGLFSVSIGYQLVEQLWSLSCLPDDLIDDAVLNSVFSCHILLELMLDDHLVNDLDLLCYSHGPTFLGLSAKP